MTTKGKDSDLFIVDNSDSDWKVQRYLSEWCDLARSMDVATGYFEIGSLLSLDSQWQKLDNIRILMGDEVSKRTKQAFIAALEKISEVLSDSLEHEKEANDFLNGVPAIVDALRNGKISCRVFKKRKFHAKAYITHGKMDVVGSAALVGSSNFTRPGLTQNVELNIQLRREVGLLQEWFEEYWEEAEDVTPEILKTIERHIRDYDPFEVYAKALQEYHSGHEMTVGEWEQKESHLFPVLAPYQQEGYQALMKISGQYGGAFLCDGVGLGKTFVGMMLLERLLIHDRRRVVLLVPKAARKPVWEASLAKYLPNLLHNRFMNLAIYNHTDLLRKATEDRDWPAEWEQIKSEADAFVIDEAHNFRNRSSERYRKLFEIIDGNKQVFHLTATPINNSLLDLQHQIELFTDREETYFNTAPLGIHSLPGHFRKMERDLEKALKADDASSILLDDADAKDVLLKDDLFRAIVVQRSRAYVVKSTEQNEEGEVAFPKREDPQVAPYSLKKVYGPLLDNIERAFKKERPLLRLAVYCPYDDPYYKGDPSKVDPFIRGRHSQVVGLIRILLLKRFESSVSAFRQTCEDLLLKLLAFVDLHRPDKSDRWRGQHEDRLKRIKDRRLGLEDEEDLDEDVIPEEIRNKWEPLPEDEFDITEIVSDTLLDMDQLADFLEDIKGLNASHDDKVQKLIHLMQTDPDLKTQKVLIFSEYMTTAQYLKEHLEAAGIGPLSEVDGNYQGDRGVVIRRFSPYYNGTTSSGLKAEDKQEIRVLISTDVRSEGLNLQDACLVINYDLHWNPVRLMQRIGRVDRRLNPEIEDQIKANHPETSEIRGKVRFWNFLPPKELNRILGLYKRVTDKTLRISKTFGIEGKKLLTEEDDYEALREFNQAYEGTTTLVEEMYLAYKKMLDENPGLEEKLGAMPLRVFSGKEHPSEDARSIFFCYRLPTQNAQTGEWTVSEGSTAWYLYDLAGGEIIDDSTAIDPVIRCEPDTPRQVKEEQTTLIEARKKIEKHIHRTYMRKTQAPFTDDLGNPIKPILLAWMEMT